MQHKEPTVSLGIAEALAQVAIEASDEPDLARTLERIVHGAATTVPAADHAHLATVQGKQAHIMAATAPSIAALAETMYRLGEGPGPTAIHDERIILVSDLRNDTRWPTFTTEAVKQGIRSMMSLPLQPTNR
ncbi:MAG TPA: GAF domain-containing protein, partial [Mycobacteriales bacterium]|nr:GAF domain-containing protein [Mycobacteriales bacterium]